MNGIAPLLPEDSLLAEVHDFARRHGLPARARNLDRNPEFPKKEFRAMGQAGLLGLSLPADLGGRGLPLRRVGVALQELGFLAGTVFAKLALQPEFSSVLGHHGSPEQRGEVFRSIVRGELLVSNQVTEPDAGSDASALRTTAEPKGNGYTITGAKSQVAFAADASLALVYARIGDHPSADGGLSVFLVPQDAPGIRREAGDDLGERWMRRGTVTYDHTPVAAHQRIGDPGCALDYLKVELTHERALLAAIYLGVARASWEETVEEVGRRQAFGRPIAAQQAVAFPLVEDGTRLAAAWLYTVRVLERLEAREPADADAAMAKWYATEVALTAIDHAIQFHGGRGYSRELPHEQRWRDVRSGTLAHGTSEIMHRLAAGRLWPRPPH